MLPCGGFFTIRNIFPTFRKVPNKHISLQLNRILLGGELSSYALLCMSQYAGFYAPNFEKVEDILVSACPFVCVCMGHGDIVLKLHVWIPHGKVADAYFWFSLNYLHLLNYGPLTNKGMKFCKCRISKRIIARNLKLVMLIGDDD